MYKGERGRIQIVRNKAKEENNNMAVGRGFLCKLLQF